MPRLSAVLLFFLVAPLFSQQPTTPEQLLAAVHNTVDLSAAGPYTLTATVVSNPDNHNRQQIGHLRIDRDHENFRVELSLPGYREVRLKLGDKLYVPRNQATLLATGLNNFDRIWDPLKEVLLPYTEKPAYGQVSRKKIRGHQALCFDERHQPKAPKLQYCIDPDRSVVLREQSDDSRYEYLDYASASGGRMFPTKAAIRKDPLVNLELRDVAVSYQPLDTARFAVPAQSIELETCQGEQLPKPVFTPSPSFTRQARANRDQATVIMHAFVAADGSVIDAQALNPTGDGLDVNARKTMLTWKFKPATCSGRPVAAEMMVEVSFKLFQQQ